MASRGLSLLSRTTTEVHGWLSPGGETRTRSTRGFRPPHLLMVTAVHPNVKMRIHKGTLTPIDTRFPTQTLPRRWVSTANCGRTSSSICLRPHDRQSLGESSRSTPRAVHRVSSVGSPGVSVGDLG